MAIITKSICPQIFAFAVFRIWKKNQIMHFLKLCLNSLQNIGQIHCISQHNNEEKRKSIKSLRDWSIQRILCQHFKKLHIILDIRFQCPFQKYSWNWLLENGHFSTQILGYCKQRNSDDFVVLNPLS